MKVKVIKSSKTNRTKKITVLVKNNSDCEIVIENENKSKSRTYLKKLRQKQDLTQSEVAKLLNISSNYYCYIENGNRKTNLDLPLIEKLATVFNISIDEIISEERKLIS